LQKIQDTEWNAMLALRLAYSGKLNWGKRACALLLLCVTTAVALPAQTFTLLHSFNNADGASPFYSGLVQGIDGNFYGTTKYGGAFTDGTVFKITPSGTLTTLHSFNSTDGANPFSGLVQAINGNFYGTTNIGGGNSCGCGTVFEITPSGRLTTLHVFTDFPDGNGPFGTLIQAMDGNLYGTTTFGGAHRQGTVFQVTPSGTLTTIFSFCTPTSCANGDAPSASLVQATDGNFYGTTYLGGIGQGISSYGTVFEITPSGTLTTLHEFDSTDGSNPNVGLVQASNGNFYGTTALGGTTGNGTLFKITPSGTLTTLYNFSATNPDPGGGNRLIQATDGNLYDTSYGGGVNGYGTIFEFTPPGTLTILHSFDSTDGAFLYAGLIQATDGNFYGTTDNGGANLLGTVFSLSVGLGPFVETRPTSGKVGGKVEILGNNLTGATSVTFNGVAAVFKVVSSTFITTTVPTGATTGKVKVVTSGGTLSSNVPFRVSP
jgi:uncharacterized repeat protein (TIGR03803 family)